MPSRLICLICGASEMEVPRMHCFPTNLEKSKVWQENMGMVFSGDCRRGQRICSRHFASDCYVGVKLRRGSEPTLYPVHRRESSIPESIEITPKIHSISTPPDIIEVDQFQEIPSTSHARTETPQLQTGKFYKGIANLSRLKASPRKQKLIELIRKNEDYIRKLKKKNRDMKSLKNYTETSMACRLFDKLNEVSQTTATFLASQIRCGIKKPNGRRWTLEDKIIALAIYKRSPNAYKFLQKVLALPSRRTILLLLQRVPLSEGINKHLFEHINKCITRTNDRLCVVIFDEMDIKPNVHYVKGDDVIMGFVHSDTGERKMANKALVFMLQGLTTKWKQPVTFYLTHTSSGSELLVTYIHEVLDAAINIAKLDVVATICDMSTINVKCMKELGSSLNRPFFVSNGKTIHTMFDPPHLLKCSASLFRKHNVNLPVEVEGKHDMMTAKFKDIVSAYNIDKNNPLVFRTLYKLKDTHLEPVMKFAMKVSVAAQVMSNTVGCYLYSLLSRGELEPRTLATATFVQQMDELFDSFNGNQLKPSVKVLKCAITDDSPHLTYWEKAYGIVNSWKYERINKKGHLMKGKPPSQIGWLTSLKAIRNIWLYVRSKGVTSLPPRRLNQDSLENAFGTIRNGCGSSDHPTTCQFISSLKTYIINGMTSQIKGNCEDDNSSLLTNMRSFLDVPLPIREPLHTDQPLPNTSYHELFTDVAESVALGQSNVLSVAYVSGFIAKRVLSIVNCDICKINLCLEQGLHNTFIWYKECNYEVQRFTYPSENLTTFVGMSVTALETFMEGYRGQKGLSQQAFAYINQIVPCEWLTCTMHKDEIKDLIIIGVVRVSIPWWCKRMNREYLEEKKDIRSTRRKLSKFSH